MRNRTYSTIIGLLLAVPLAHAAPFIISDPLDPAATHCGWKVDAGVRSDVPVALSGTAEICKFDIGALIAGSHTVSATAVAIDPVYGRRESVPSANFPFTVPAVPPVPSGLRLQP